MDLKVLIFCYGVQNFQDFQSWSPNTSLSNGLLGVWTFRILLQVLASITRKVPITK